MEHSVAIAAIARNENLYINEWIQYHRELGIAHFYIYDNSFGNEPRLEQAIDQKHVGYVTVVDAYEETAYQKEAYTDAYQRFGGKHDYMMFIDKDEFFTLCQHGSI